ncbi:tRNA(adenine34) deaminase [Caldicoprobacter faecalis]|uniref:tRNA-specific adenosine deaminase n=2 Tax=Caldicoprobacter faecalis TaxID=937334 RepID=A0A1I5VTM1_9FIRM|nr:tRNA(adenine34) deaminase [Caldicoprobacter faecalis]
MVLLFRRFMEQALLEAQKAYDMNEVPIGAVVVKDGEIIARGHNLRETGRDPTLHAEMVAIREAARYLGGWRLTGCELYVTIEPCPMCAGAIIQARIQRVVFGAMDPKAGCAGSLYNLLQDPRFNHQVEVVGGVMEEECRRIMQDFFRKKREK